MPSLRELGRADGNDYGGGEVGLMIVSSLVALSNYYCIERKAEPEHR